MTLDELINLAQEQGIYLGKNPKRTLRYYVSRGLMSPPQIEYEGKTKKAVYSLENLVQLKLIYLYKKQGYRLDEIKNKLKEPVFWSDEAIEFMRPFKVANNYPEDAFQKSKPADKAEIATFIVHLIEAVKNGQLNPGEIKDFFIKAVINKNGQPLFEPEIENLLKENSFLERT